jgi:type IV pilus assembly protein PilB
MPVRIGELLLKEKRITPAQLQEALAYQKANGGKLGFNLVKLGFVKDEEITALLSKQYGVPSINLTQFEIDPGIIKLIPAEPVVASETAVLEAITRYYAAPTGARASREAAAGGGGGGGESASMSSASSLDMVTKALEQTSIDDDVEVLEELEQIDVASLERQGGEAPVIRLVNLMLTSTSSRTRRSSGSGSASTAFCTT